MSTLIEHAHPNTRKIPLDVQGTRKKTGTAVTPGIRQQQKETTRSDILAAARKLFIERGYENTSTRQIADAAGVGVGTIFAHFAEKNRLLRELLLSDIEKILISSRLELDLQASAVEALLHYSGHLFTYYRSQWALSRVLLQDIMFDATAYQGQVDAFVNELTRRLMVDAPGLDQADRETLAQCMMANYFMVLINGLGLPESTMETWLNQLSNRCKLLVESVQHHVRNLPQTSSELERDARENLAD